MEILSSKKYKIAFFGRLPPTFIGKATFSERILPTAQGRESLSEGIADAAQGRESVARAFHFYQKDVECSTQCWYIIIYEEKSNAPFGNRGHGFSIGIFVYRPVLLL